MKTTQQGVDLIKHHEGLRLTAYLDAVGKLTIGYGHLIRPGEGMGKITRERAEQLFAEDLLEHEQKVSSLVQIPLTRNQFSALVSFTFNLGAQRLATSTLLKKLNRSDIKGAATEFSRWVYGKVNGQNKKLAGLIRRRADEKEMFLAPDDIHSQDETDEVETDSLALDQSSLDEHIGDDLAEPVAQPMPEPIANLSDTGSPTRPGLIEQAKAIVSSPDSPARSIITGNTGLAIKGAAPTTVLGSILLWVETHPGLVITIIVCATVLLLAVIFREFIEKKFEAMTNADPYKHNIEFVRKS